MNHVKHITLTLRMEEIQHGYCPCIESLLISIIDAGRQDSIDTINELIEEFLHKKATPIRLKT